MKKTIVDPGKVVLLIGLTLVLFPILLTSCSFFQQEAKPVVQIPPAPPQIVHDPTLPYREVDFKRPVSHVTDPKIFVYKGKRRLLVVDNDTLVREFRISLGFSPSGDKKRQGDGRTPEGEFYVCVKNANSSYYKSVGLSYPMPRHAEQALIAGNISQAQFARIVHAIETKSRPPWDTRLGGQIFIHGGGAEWDWTLGCIALFNTSMDDLFDMVRVGTPVTILP